MEKMHSRISWNTCAREAQEKKPAAPIKLYSGCRETSIKVEDPYNVGGSDTILHSCCLNAVPKNGFSCMSLEHEKDDTKVGCDGVFDELISSHPLCSPPSSLASPRLEVHEEIIRIGRDITNQYSQNKTTAHQCRGTATWPSSSSTFSVPSCSPPPRSPSVSSIDKPASTASLPPFASSNYLFSSSTANRSPLTEQDGVHSSHSDRELSVELQKEDMHALQDDTLTSSERVKNVSFTPSSALSSFPSSFFFRDAEHRHWHKKNEGSFGASPPPPPCDASSGVRGKYASYFGEKIERKFSGQPSAKNVKKRIKVETPLYFSEKVSFTNDSSPLRIRNELVCGESPEKGSSTLELLEDSSYYLKSNFRAPLPPYQWVKSSSNCVRTSGLHKMCKAAPTLHSLISVSQGESDDDAFELSDIPPQKFLGSASSSDEDPSIVTPSQGEDQVLISSCFSVPSPLEWNATFVPPSESLSADQQPIKTYEENLKHLDQCGKDVEFRTEEPQWNALPSFYSVLNPPPPIMHFNEH